MARILFASELGSNLGHIGQLLPLASELKSRGHEVVFALRDVARADAMLRPHGFRYLQAPLWQGRARRDAKAPSSYSEILQHYGFADRAGLLGVVSAWRDLYSFVEPDVVLCEYAPAALLAARGMKAARVSYGVGFSLPPKVSPFPNFRTWEDVPQVRLEASDAAALATANRVLERLGVEQLSTLQDLLHVDEEFLCTFRELDHYPDRPGDVQYRGPISTPDEGVRAFWPENGDKRVFVYLSAATPAFEAIAQHLSDAGHSVLWVAPGVAPEVARRFETERFKFSRGAVRLSDVAPAADAALLHGGHGTVSAMLLAGVPLALFPMHTEQAIVARNVLRTGAGTAVSGNPDPMEVGALLKRVLEDVPFKQAAIAFASRYGSYDPLDAVRAIADSRCFQR